MEQEDSRNMTMIVQRVLESCKYYSSEAKGLCLKELIDVKLRRRASWKSIFTLVDPRLVGLSLIETPPILFTLIPISCLLMIKHKPKLMESRRLFELIPILMVDDFTQVGLNLTLCVHVISHDKFVYDIH